MSRQANCKRVVLDGTGHGSAFEPLRRDIVQSHLSVERVLSDLREMLRSSSHQIAEATGVDIDAIRQLRPEAQRSEQGRVDRMDEAKR